MNITTVWAYFCGEYNTIIGEEILEKSFKKNNGDWEKILYLIMGLRECCKKDKDTSVSAYKKVALTKNTVIPVLKNGEYSPVLFDKKKTIEVFDNFIKKTRDSYIEQTKGLKEKSPEKFTQLIEGIKILFNIKKVNKKSIDRHF